MPNPPGIATQSHNQNEDFPESEAIATMRTGRIVAMAGEIFGDPKKALLWLSTPNERLARRAPLEVLHTELGGQSVESMLWQLDEGIHT